MVPPVLLLNIFKDPDLVQGKPRRRFASVNKSLLIQNFLILQSEKCERTGRSKAIAPTNEMNLSPDNFLELAIESRLRSLDPKGKHLRVIDLCGCQRIDVQLFILLMVHRLSLPGVA